MQILNLTPTRTVIAASALAQPETSATATTAASNTDASGTVSGTCTATDKLVYDKCSTDLATCKLAAAEGKKCSCYPTYFTCIKPYTVRKTRKCNGLADSDKNSPTNSHPSHTLLLRRARISTVRRRRLQTNALTKSAPSAHRRRR